MESTGSKKGFTGSGSTGLRSRLKAAAAGPAVVAIILMAAVRGLAIEQQAGEHAQRPAISVRVYTYVRVPPDDLATAERVASKIFEQAGVNLTWSECPQTDREARQTPYCLAVNSATEIFLRIVPDFPDGSFLNKSSMGFALATPPPDRGYLASISYARVRKQLLGTPGLTFLTLGQLMGVGMAHEMGHLLLGTNSHSPAGLMCARWNARELMLGAYAKLNFSAAQAKVICADVQARIGDQASRQQAAQARPSFNTARVLHSESGEVCSQITTVGICDTALSIFFRAKPWVTATRTESTWSQNALRIRATVPRMANAPLLNGRR